MTAINLRGVARRNAVVCDNIIEGPLRWEDGRNEDHYGVRVYGTGHIIHHNRIFNCWDAIQVGADCDSIETSGCDVYGNEIYCCTDDGIETDRSRHNIRVFANRMTNVLTGVSCQPVYGGPIYMVRNVVYNCQLKPMKFHVWPTGMLVYSTCYCAYPLAWYAGQWKNGHLRNNLFLGGSHSACNYDPTCIYDNPYQMDMDYDGFYRARSDRFANFDHVSYPTLVAFQAATGMEMHAVLLDSTAFVAAEGPPLGSCVGAHGYPPPYAPGSQDLRLRPDSPAIDAGIFLANIIEGYGGSAPDLGAYEYGQPLPAYGPEDDADSAVLGAGPRLRAMAVHGSFPDPFFSVTQLRFDLALPSKVTAGVYDASGRLVRRLLSGERLMAGSRVLEWDGRDDQGIRVPGRRVT